jgi:hypothetical protein
LVDARVKPEVADRLARCRKAADVADRGRERRRADHVDARHREQPPQPARLERLARDLALDRGDL